MAEDQECVPLAPCLVDEKELEHQRNVDPRSLCQTIIPSAAKICQPKSCPIRKPLEKDEEKESEAISVQEEEEQEKTILLPMKPPTGTCKYTEAAAKPPEDAEGSIITGSVLDPSAAMDFTKFGGFSEGPAAVLAAFGGSDAAKESLASMGAVSLGGALICECCNCDPCICEPRGLSIENIMAALKLMMGSTEDFHKLLNALGPRALEAMENVLGKHAGEAALWATGTAFEEQTPQQTASDLAREAWLRGDFDEMRSCQCLPGMCLCPGGHYVYKKKIGEGKEEKKVVKKEKEKKPRLSETCICPSTKHFSTPVSSETEISGYAIPTKRLFWRDLMICTCPKLERTLVILKPEVVRFKDVVLRAIKKYGFDVLSERTVQLSPEEASELYAKYYGQARFPNIVVSISQAPVVVVSIGGLNVIQRWSNLIGPDGVLPSEWFLPNWIRRKFGYIQEIPDVLHGSKGFAAADSENRYFFPQSILEPVIKNRDDVKSYMDTFINPTLLRGLAYCAKTRPVDPLIFLAEWLLINNPFQPHFPTNVALTPT